MPKVLNIHISYHFTFAFIIRVVLIIYSCIQDSYFDVKYTDIDYEVFTDAASYVHKGMSPFERSTYRYTPILAIILLPNIYVSKLFGKLLFAFLDIVTSYLIYQIQKVSSYNARVCKISCFLWLYNPMSMVISTRGSSEAIMTALIMLVVYLHKKKSPVLCGLAYGISVHCKIYPCIYATTLYFAFTNFNESMRGLDEKIKYLLYPNRARLLFVFSTIVGFGIPTLVFAYIYGIQYVEEALLYHLTRKDIRHNFAPYFYILYLSETFESNVSSILSIVALIVQAHLVFTVSFVFCHPQTLPICLFLQTFAFVTFNKVCTSQYFLWYLCLLPLNCHVFELPFKKVLYCVFLWALGQAIWIYPAYLLEFNGYNTYSFLWMASILFFSINISLMFLFTKFCFQENIFYNIRNKSD